MAKTLIEQMKQIASGKGPEGKKNAMILGSIGIVLAIVGVGIITIPGAPMRGSGLGTLSLITGIVLLIVAFLRIKRAK